MYEKNVHHPLEDGWKSLRWEDEQQLACATLALRDDYSIFRKQMGEMHKSFSKFAAVYLHKEFEGCVVDEHDGAVVVKLNIDGKDIEHTYQAEDLNGPQKLKWGDKVRAIAMLVGEKASQVDRAGHESAPFRKLAKARLKKIATKYYG